MPRDVITALALLPTAYADAMRLRIAGATPERVGETLGLDRSSVEPLLTLADAKLRELLLADDDPEPDHEPTRSEPER